jgi:integrase/recombinase XerD
MKRKGSKKRVRSLNLTIYFYLTYFVKFKDLTLLFSEGFIMRYQYRREPLTIDEANRNANACRTHKEKLVVWTLLDTGIRVSELAGLKKNNFDWQTHRVMVYGKGGPYGRKTKRRIVPLSPRIQPLVDRGSTI